MKSLIFAIIVGIISIVILIENKPNTFLASIIIEDCNYTKDTFLISYYKGLKLNRPYLTDDSNKIISSNCNRFRILHKIGNKQ